MVKKLNKAVKYSNFETTTQHTKEGNIKENEYTINVSKLVNFIEF